MDRTLRLTTVLSYQREKPWYWFGVREWVEVSPGLVSEKHLRAEAGNFIVDGCIRLGVLVDNDGFTVVP